MKVKDNIETLASHQNLPLELSITEESDSFVISDETRIDQQCQQNRETVLNHPKITVIMPVFNGEQYLKMAIDSILNQTLTDFEFIIIDDNSSDGSLEIIKSYDDHRIKLIRNDANLGTSASKNKALEASLGEYVAFLDCDDYAYPSRLAEQLEFMENNPDFGMVGSWVEVMDTNSELTGEVWRYIESHHKIPAILLFQNYFAQSAVFMRKSALPDRLYKYEPAEDYDLWVRLSRNFPVGNLQKFLIRYRLHSNSLSQKSIELINKNIQDIISYQLNELGIEPTEKELELHRQLGTYHYNFTNQNGNYIQAVENWLNKLKDANQKSGRYDSSHFHEVLTDRQFHLYSKYIEFQENQLQSNQADLEQKRHQLQEQTDELNHNKSWLADLQAGKDWLETQYHNWMQVAQQTQTALEQSQSQLQQTQTALEQSQSQLQQTQTALEQSQSQLQQTQTALEQSQSQLQQTQTALEQSQSQLQQTQTALEQSQSQLQQTQTEIIQLKSSKFWKLRTQWFNLKRFLGFCD
jgi:glycosyltransferase involved in cell wall biosynthesis